MSEEETKDLTVRQPDSIVLSGEGISLYTELMSFVGKALEADKHYGLVPYAKKPSLFKGGAQILAGEAGLIVPAYDEVRVTIDHETGFYAYEYRAPVIRRETGEVVAEGFGACNTKERRFLSEKTDRGFSQHQCASQARKRAYVDGIIQALRLSGVFTFSMEDLARQEPTGNNEPDSSTYAGVDEEPQEKKKDSLTLARESCMARVSELKIDSGWHSAWCIKEYILKESRDEMDEAQWRDARKQLDIMVKQADGMLEGQIGVLNKHIIELGYTGSNDPNFLAVMKNIASMAHITVGDAVQVDPETGAKLIDLLWRKVKANRAKAKGDASA